MLNKQMEVVMARLAKKNEVESKIGDEFEALIATKGIKFRKAEVNDLPNEWAKKLVRSFLIKNKLMWKLGDVKLQGAVCIKVWDPFLQYLDIFPSKLFMWCTKDHHEGVHPDDALLHMLSLAEKRK